MTPDNPDLYLAAALRRDVERHEAGQFETLGSEYDQTESDTAPFRDRASETFHLAFKLWDSWIDAANHEWQYHPGIRRDDWPRLARRVVAALETGEEVVDPELLERFGPPTPSRLRRLWARIFSSWT